MKLESAEEGSRMSAHNIEPHLLLELTATKMPFGKYSGRLLIDLPEPYVVWFAQRGFPQGKLGEMLAMVYEVKVNGLEYLFDPLRSIHASSEKGEREKM